MYRNPKETILPITEDMFMPSIKYFKEHSINDIQYAVYNSGITPRWKQRLNKHRRQPYTKVIISHMNKRKLKKDLIRYMNR